MVRRRPVSTDFSYEMLVRSPPQNRSKIAAFEGELPKTPGIGRGRKMLVNTAARG
jgi:hypothetical protein